MHSQFYLSWCTPVLGSRPEVPNSRPVNVNVNDQLMLMLKCPLSHYWTSPLSRGASHQLISKKRRSSHQNYFLFTTYFLGGRGDWVHQKVHLQLCTPWIFSWGAAALSAPMGLTIVFAFLRGPSHIQNGARPTSLRAKRRIFARMTAGVCSITAGSAGVRRAPKLALNSAIFKWPNLRSQKHDVYKF